MRVNWDAKRESNDHTEMLKGLKSKERPTLTSFPTAALEFFEGRYITAETTHLYERGLGAEGKPLRKAVSDKPNLNCHLFFAFLLSISATS